MVGQASAPAWLQRDWLLGQFGEERAHAQASDADFVRQGIGDAIISDDLRHQVFLGGEDFAERHRGTAKPLELLGAVPRAQRRALAEPMARAFATGVYTMQEIAAVFGVHYSRVSRAVRRFAVERCSRTTAASRSRRA